ncbi:hypothetical protein ABEX25_18645 [Paenibacillus thiaminolyticus]|uniref:hypothetical protein n=1 Tax=Paenibacillus thiaminolyticus TaxID=49283 RepID=UPI003D287237
MSRALHQHVPAEVTDMVPIERGRNEWGLDRTGATPFTRMQSGDRFADRERVKRQSRPWSLNNPVNLDSRDTR